MTYEVGSVTIQGAQPSNVIHTVFGRKTTDGGKARIRNRRGRLGCGRDHPSPRELREALDYEPDTGIFRWKVKAGSDRATNSWNARFVGNVAGSVNHNGYIYIAFGEEKYAAHRIAWAHHFGDWPLTELDHIDRNPANNRIANLRLATREQNVANTKLRSTNTSGLKGVTYIQPEHRWKPEYCWVANIRMDGKVKNLGHFATKEEAGAAYEAAARAYYGQYYPPSDLIMDHADPERCYPNFSSVDNGMPSDSQYCAPDTDLA